jgi:hypothetical protein
MINERKNNNLISNLVDQDHAFIKFTSEKYTGICFMRRDQITTILVFMVSIFFMLKLKM